MTRLPTRPPANPAGEVAKGLTDAQRKWLFYGSPDSRSGYWPVRNAMYRKGLIGKAGELSRLGLAVRDHLSQPLQGAGE